jgi:ribose transport system ATP-binding protein
MRARPLQGEALLRVEGLSVGGVLEDVSFTLHAGEVLGIAGLVGAGRTELLRAIFGADRIERGKVSDAAQLRRDHPTVGLDRPAP